MPDTRRPRAPPWAQHSSTTRWCGSSPRTRRDDAERARGTWAWSCSTVCAGGRCGAPTTPRPSPSGCHRTAATCASAGCCGSAWPVFRHRIRRRGAGVRRLGDDPEDGSGDHEGRGCETRREASDGAHDGFAFHPWTRRGWLAALLWRRSWRGTCHRPVRTASDGGLPLPAGSASAVVVGGALAPIRMPRRKAAGFDDGRRQTAPATSLIAIGRLPRGPLARCSRVACHQSAGFEPVESSHPKSGA